MKLDHHTHQPGQDVSVYLHIPFCRTVCPYCNFAVVQDKARRGGTGPHDRYMRALFSELDRRLAETAQQGIPSIYFGGGTPSRVGAPWIAEAIETIRKFALLAEGAEITLEANPEDVQDGAVDAWLNAGVNRLSLGVQSFDPAVLKRLGRAHTVGMADAALDRASSRVEISVDLIYGAPDQTVASFIGDLRRLEQWPIRHLSAYALTVEEGTPYERARTREALPLKSEDEYEAFYDALRQWLADRNWEHYEISNAAQPGFRARHNSRYWQRQSYLGVGMGAHSYDAGLQQRRANTEDFASYLSSALAGEVERSTERLGPAEILTETAMLGLRTLDGLAVADLPAGWERAPSIGRGLGEGAMQLASGRLRLSADQWLRADSWTLEVIEDLGQLIVDDGMS